MSKLSTTITKKFFEMKMQDLERDGHFIEYKEMKPFWDVRLTLEKRKMLKIMVFLVGNKPFRFKVDGTISGIPREMIPAEYRGAIKTDFAYAIKCIPLDVIKGDV